MTIQTTASGISSLHGKALICREHLIPNQPEAIAFSGEPKRARSILRRIEAMIASTSTSRDRRTFDQLQRLVLHTAERMIRVAPHHGVFEQALNEISFAYASGVLADSSSRVTGLAVYLLDCDTLDYTRMARRERWNCHALIARHYAG